jgi:hypothetical protein
MLTLGALLTIFGLMLATLFGLVFAVAILWALRRRQHRSELNELALQIGMRLDHTGLRLRLDDQDLKFQLLGNGNGEATFTSVGLPKWLEVRAEHLADRFKEPDLQVADVDFDGKVRLCGPSLKLHGVLDEVNRQRILRLIGLGGRIKNGRMEAELHAAELNAGDIGPLMDLSRSLARHEEPTRRLAETLRQEPPGPVRASMYRTLMAEGAAAVVDEIRAEAEGWDLGERVQAGIVDRSEVGEGRLSLAPTGADAGAVSVASEAGQVSTVKS